MAVTEAALHAVCDRPSLFAFLRDSLRWPVDPEDTFTYAGPQLHGDVAARAEVSQIVPFTAGDPFTIMLAEFSTAFRRTDLREILRRMREEIRKRAKYGGRSLDEIVFVVATENYKGLRFVRFEERKGRAPRLSSFGWTCGQAEGTRTLREINLPALTMPPSNLLGEPDWGQARWADAWNVEAVTKEFFRLYRDVFEELRESVKGVRGDQRLFMQRLCNRLMFVQFLSKKGWLNRDRNYLRTLYDVARDHAAKPGVAVSARANFYPDFLHPLFFKALNTPADDRLEDAEWSTLSQWLGDVPFLNGGLFAPQDSDDDRRAVTIPNDAFAPLLDLFDRFNFTLTESSPDDVEVAVDPEMLGKVFEELVTEDERHGTGSYYTPRGIVSFMCREALKGYLGGGEAVARFVDEGDPTALRDPEAVLEALKTITVCDPACGSGAYLLGMMQELLRLREGLFAAKVRDFRRIYDRKLEIIQRNLYGVDKEPFAVNIAMLRLWLSLVVDDERNPLDDPTVDVSLPNLRFKIQQGDALTAPMPDLGSLAIFGDTFCRDAARLRALHDEYFAPPAPNGPKRAKSVIEREIEEEQEKIANLLGSHAPERAVDWCVRFAEVFAPTHATTSIGGGLNLGTELAEEPEPGGFDVVLANPPYVRQELIRDLKPTLQRVFPEVYTGTADLYVFFYARALQLLRPGGMLSFISSNKWFRAGYGAKLRFYMAKTTSVLSITDFGELPVFQTAATFPVILVTRKGIKEGGGPVFTQVKSLERPFPDVLAIIREQGSPLPTGALHGANWMLAGSGAAGLRLRMEAAGPTLAELNVELLNGVKTGYNRAYLVDDDTRARLLAESHLWEQFLFPYLMGDEIRKYRVDTPKKWVIYLRWTDVLPGGHPVMHYLQDHREALLKRDGVKDGGTCPWFALSRPRPESFPYYRQPKIVFPDIAKESRFALDTSGAVVDATAFVIPGPDLFLLGVLNSAAMWDYLKCICAVVGDADQGGRLRLKRIYLEGAPIPRATPGDRSAIAALAQKCLDVNGAGCEPWEEEINERVAALYGL